MRAEEACRAASAATAAPPPPAPPRADVEDDDDDAAPAACVTWLFGAGSSVWPFVRTELTVCVVAVLVMIVAAILSAPSVCPPARCTLLNESLSRWLYYIAACLVISIPGRVGDRVFFAAVATVGQWLTLSMLLPIFFYVSAFEGSLSRMWWLSMLWTVADSFVGLRDADAAVFDNVMRSLLAFQLLSIGRQLALRVTLRTVLIGSFEQRIQDVLFQNLIALTLGQGHVLDAAGSGRMVPQRRETAIRELLRMYRLEDFRRKLDFVSKARFRLFSRAGEVVALAKKEPVAAFAKAAFRKLAALPPGVLVEVERKTEQITSLVSASELRQVLGAGGGGGGGGGGLRLGLGAASARGLTGGSASGAAVRGGGGGGGGGGGSGTPGFDASGSQSVDGSTPRDEGVEGGVAPLSSESHHDREGGTSRVGAGSSLVRSPALGAGAFPLGGEPAGRGRGGGGSSGGRERAGTASSMLGELLDKAREAVSSVVQQTGTRGGAGGAGLGLGRLPSFSTSSPKPLRRGTSTSGSSWGGDWPAAAAAAAAAASATGQQPGMTNDDEPVRGALGSPVMMEPAGRHTHSASSASTLETVPESGPLPPAASSSTGGGGYSAHLAAPRGGAGRQPPITSRSSRSLSASTFSPPNSALSAATSATSPATAPAVDDPWGQRGSVALPETERLRSSTGTATTSSSGGPGWPAPHAGQHSGGGAAGGAAATPAPFEAAPPALPGAHHGAMRATSEPPRHGFYAATADSAGVPAPVSARGGGSSSGHHSGSAVRFDLNSELGGESELPVGGRAPAVAAAWGEAPAATHAVSGAGGTATAAAATSSPHAVDPPRSLQAAAAHYSAGALNRLLHGGAGADGAGAPHASASGGGAAGEHAGRSIGVTMGRLLREQLRGVLHAYVPREELEEVAAIAGLDVHDVRDGSGSGGGSGAGGLHHPYFSHHHHEPAAATAAGISEGGRGDRGGAPPPLPLPPPPSESAALAHHGAPYPLRTQPPPPPAHEHPRLRLAHFAAVIEADSGLDPEKAFALFDTNSDGLVTLEEFTHAHELIFEELRSLKAALSGHQSVSTAMQSLLDVLFWAALVVTVLLIFDVNAAQVYIPLGTVLVSASFAIGSSISQVVSSLIFVLVTRPYNVGDRVTASGLFNGDETLVVKTVDVLTTSFTRLTNKVVTVPNWSLCQMAIENFKRSPSAVLKVELAVSSATSAAQLEALRRRVDAYLASLPLAWKPACVIRCSGLRDQALLLSLWCNSHYMWQDAPRLFRASFLLHLALVEFLREGGIAFRLADQSLRLEGTVLTRPAPELLPAGGGGGSGGGGGGGGGGGSVGGGGDGGGGNGSGPTDGRALPTKPAPPAVEAEAVVPMAAASVAGIALVSASVDGAATAAASVDAAAAASAPPAPLQPPPGVGAPQLAEMLAQLHVMQQAQGRLFATMAAAIGGGR